MRPAVGSLTGRGVSESLSRLRCVRERMQLRDVVLHDALQSNRLTTIA